MSEMYAQPDHDSDQIVKLSMIEKSLSRVHDFELSFRVALVIGIICSPSSTSSLLLSTRRTLS